ncbi:hypothetical protein PHLGIDRAFT_118062 [Phlebiopsis gigantea 11061_1 CR5-6]|uniref:Transmembrane protein n=1 Tax=Phlebiopsis gigantea (strain 11061_1 CR5-6) TaxID=745531 RepID=A0A0C3PLS7_PHLG1|nr:hypothetical protein PHLGIDRAFT_118062 [Phlebiopsis gigantea 11061_1 CR5-6]
MQRCGTHSSPHTISNTSARHPAITDVINPALPPNLKPRASETKVRHVSDGDVGKRNELETCDLVSIHHFSSGQPLRTTLVWSTASAWRNSMSNAGTVIVDDQPTGNVLQYNGDWSHLYSLANAVNNTLSYTAEAGNSVILKFNGTGVGVVGATAPVGDKEPPISTYVIDGGSPVTYTAPTNITATLFSQTFFLQQSLSASEHTLVINVTRASDAAPFLLDYIGYVPLSNTTNSTSATSSSLPSSSAASTSTPSTAGVSTKSATPVGAIVGGTIGGVALIVITVLGVLLLRSKRRGGRPYFYGAGRTSDMLEQEVKDDDVLPTPPQQLSPQIYHPSATQASPQTAAVAHTTPFMSVSAIPSGSTPQAVYLGPSTQRKNAQGPTITPAPAAFHEDSGVRFVAQPQPQPQPESVPEARTEIPDDVPPQYTEH